MSGESGLEIRCFTGAGFGQNGYVVRCSGTRAGVLIDPGAAVDDMLGAVERDRVDIVAILLTHAHIDHIVGVPRAKEATGAPIHLHRDDVGLYRGAAVQANMFGLEMPPLPPIDEHLADGGVVGFGDCRLDVRHAPGHAPGHVVLVGEGVAFVGDCVFAGSIGRTDLPGGDFQTLMSSIRRQILSLPDDTTLHPGHGEATTVGRERATNPFLVPHFGGSEFA